MWTYARRPSPSRTTEIASSKSFAVSGSIVIVGRSRRSVRPSRLGGGGSGTASVAPLLSPLVEQPLEHGVDVARGSEDALHAGPAAAGADDDEIARPRVVETVAIDDERNAGREVRVADDELPALAQLDDDLAACGGLVTHLAQPVTHASEGSPLR